MIPTSLPAGKVLQGLRRLRRLEWDGEAWEGRAGAWLQHGGISRTNIDKELHAMTNFRSRDTSRPLVGAEGWMLEIERQRCKQQVFPFWETSWPPRDGEARSTPICP